MEAEQGDVRGDGAPSSAKINNTTQHKGHKKKRRRRVDQQQKKAKKKLLPAASVRSRGVPHPSTTTTYGSLVLEFGWDPTHSTKCDRWHQFVIFYYYLQVTTHHSLLSSQHLTTTKPLKSRSHHLPLKLNKRTTRHNTITNYTTQQTTN